MTPEQTAQLAALRERIEEAHADGCGHCSVPVESIACLLALLDDAERERDEAKVDEREACENNALLLIEARDARIRVTHLAADLTTAHERAATAERERIVGMLRHRAEKFEASLKIQRRYANQRNMGEYAGIIKQEAFAETYRAAADAIEIGAKKD